jgi:chromate transport protein ChrA
MHNRQSDLTMKTVLAAAALSMALPGPVAADTTVTVAMTAGDIPIATGIPD